MLTALLTLGACGPGLSEDAEAINALYDLYTSKNVKLHYGEREGLPSPTEEELRAFEQLIPKQYLFPEAWEEAVAHRRANGLHVMPELPDYSGDPDSEVELSRHTSRNADRLRTAFREWYEGGGRDR